MSSSKCARCDKTVYPVEGLRCLDKIWHKGCFKCHECNMTLNMKNYKGFEKRPYCNAHCPQAKATTVADTPEIRRLAENTRIQSQAKYHEDFEKSKGKNFTTIADDPETRRVKETSKIISNVAYHGEIERKKQMEERRGPNGTDEMPLIRGESGMMMNNNSVTSNNNNLSPKFNRNSKNLSQMHEPTIVPKQQPQHFITHPNQHQQAQQQYQQQQLQRQQQFMQQQQQLLKQQQYLAQQQQKQQQITVNRQSLQMDQAGGAARHQQQIQQQQQPQQQHFNQQHMLQMQRQQQLLQMQQVNTPIMSSQPSSKQAVLARTNHNHHPIISTQNNYQMLSSANNNVIVSSGKPMPSAVGGHMVAHQLDNPNAHLSHGPPPPHGGQMSGVPGTNGHRLAMMVQQQQHMPNGIMPKQQSQAIHPHGGGGGGQAMLSPQHHHHHHQAQHQMQQMRPAMVQAHPSARMQLPQVPRRVYRAMYDYVANDIDEVSFYENDLLVDCVNVDRNWLIGKVARSGQTGMLPANYVSELPSQ